jgi:hypothetical protein
MAMPGLGPDVDLDGVGHVDALDAGLDLGWGGFARISSWISLLEASSDPMG